MPRFAAALFVLALMLAAKVAVAQPPALSHLVPAAIRPGQSVDVTLFGENLAGASAVWTSFPCPAELTPGIDQNGAQPGSVSYRFTIPADAPESIGGIRLATGKGCSNLRLVLIDAPASVADNGNNHTLETAQPIVPPLAVDGACDPEAADFYKFTAAAGQKATFEIVARRMGSPLDPLLRLLDAGGRELAASDDEPALGVDARIVHTFSAAGDYMLEIRDIRHQGGVRHRYRIRVGDLPPLASIVGGLTTASPQPTVETEPNDTPETSTTTSLPGMLEGRFQVQADRDTFQFEAKQGQRFLFRGQTRSLGSPADLFLRVYKSDGALAGEIDDAGGDEGVLDFTVPADGVYRLAIEELNGRGGEELTYRIAVEPYEPGFTLSLEAEKFDAPRWGVFQAKVACARRDYNGPITLSIDAGGDEIKLANSVIPEGQKEIVFSATLPVGWQSGRLATARIVGRAKIGERDCQATASDLTVLRAALGGLAYPPAALDGTLGIGVGPVFPEFFQLAAAPRTGPLSDAGGAAMLKVTAQRLNGFEDKIDLTVEGLPPGVTAKPAAIEKGQPEAAIELAGEAAPAGVHRIRVVGSAVFQNQPKRVVLDLLELEIGPAK